MESLLTPKDVKLLLKCSLPWVYKAASAGLLPCVRIPCLGLGEKRKKDLVRFREQDLRSFIEKYYHRD
jgi:hypothetical protein